jgi:hypothetical protein
MSDTKLSFPNLKPLSDEQLERIGGGTCSPDDITGILESLKENYETLVDFTSYVIERVANSTGT